MAMFSCKPQQTMLKMKVGSSVLQLLTLRTSSITRPFACCSKVLANYCRKDDISRNYLLFCNSKVNLGSRKFFVRCQSQSSYKGNFMAKFSEEIDLDALRDQKVQEFRKTGRVFHVNEVVKEILAEKCDEALSNLTPEDQKKLKVIQLEHDFLFSQGFAIPSADEMISENWLEALNLSSKQRRLRYYIAWQKKKFIKESDKIKKRANQEEVEVVPQDPSVTKLENERKIFLRLYSSTVKRWNNHRLASAMQFGIPLVLDMDYSDHMQNREIRNTADQILDLYSSNRKDEAIPFHLHLTGCPSNNPIYRMLQILFQDDPHMMATVTDKSYLDLFDRKQLVYLSPNGKQVMRQFDPNAVYIIGAFNDKATQKPISYARAKEFSIKCQRLPLDEYLDWNVGSKSLTMNQMMSIMTTLKNKNSWLKALKAVPSRKQKF